MEKNLDTNQKPEFWLGLEQYYADPAFAKMAESEFLSSPLKEEDGKDGFARREFLKLMGASLAMATTACVRRPVQTILPYVQAPKEITPGEAAFYASTWYDGQEGCGLLVKTMEGRPLKVEGNPLHPMNTGKLPARAHAEVLHLYDPDRLRGPKRNMLNKNRTNFESVDLKWEDADTQILAALKKGGVAVLTSTLPSPSTQSVLADFTKSFDGKHYVFDSLSSEAVREAQAKSYGKGVLPRYRLDEAKLVVTVDADILGTYISPTEFTRQFSAKRKPGKDMLRLVSFESSLTLTGMNSDDRMRIKPSQQFDVILGLIAQVAKLSGGQASVPASLQAFVAKYADVANKLGVDSKLFSKVAKELWENRGKSLVISGGLAAQTEMAVQTQVAVNLLNSILQNDGKTVDYDNSFETYAGSFASLEKLVGEMNAGKVKTLIIHNVNPGYVLPKEMKFSEATAKVETVIYVGNYIDESGRLAHYVLPPGGAMEEWGDYELQKGLYSIQQPTLRPLFDTRSFNETLYAWSTKATAVPAKVKSAANWYEYVRGTWKSEVFPKAPANAKGSSFEDFWNHVLQTGAVATLNREKTSPSRSFNAASLMLKAAKEISGLELVLYPSVALGDGRYANVPWLQELPDPVSKIVWDNYLAVSPEMAQKEGLQDGTIVELTVGSKTVKIPVFRQPGMHDSVVALAVGYGRDGAGKVAKDIGVNAFALASVGAGQLVTAGLPVSLKKTSERYELACTHLHHSMEGRQLVVETTNDAYAKNPASGIHKHEIFSIWSEHKYTNRKWAMSIDLNTCTGCSACVIACQSENNVPVVGKKYVMQGREMHWIRIDRYYKGTPDNPEAVFQPLTCQQCENAPCETVCPVAATVHSDEGLNDMVYNRCVGTRYCSNNCPYKVRRFNWFNYSKIQAPLHMALNPDVSTRSRGVMEKCTFCVQRIRKETGIAKVTGEKLKDGVIKTACEETCPADAIVFGDLNDPESRVAKIFAEKRAYSLLEEVNAVPRVRYLSKIRNAERVIEEHEHSGSPEKKQHEQHKEGGHV